MKSFWEERYGKEDYAYGKEPNVYFARQLAECKAGKILLAAEGEGRNAVYAAKCGWDTYAFDQSIQGKEKAMRLAQEKGVHIQYEVQDCLEIRYPYDFFDAIALIFAHFPASVKSKCHHHLKAFLRPGGKIIFEAFSKQHIAYQATYPKIGGPTDKEMLFSGEEIIEDFSDFEIIELLETETELAEGPYHIGKGSVIRFTGIKKEWTKTG